MTEIKNTEIVVSKLGRWYPGDLAFIEYLEYSSDNLGASSTLKLTSLFQRRDQNQRRWPSDDTDFYRISLLFKGVKNFFINDFGIMPKQIMGFDIVNISDKGWENINFEIEDYENGQIGLLCASVEIVSVEKVENRDT